VRSEKTQVQTATATKLCPDGMRRRVPLATLTGTSRKTATKILVEFAKKGLVGLGRINIPTRSNFERLSVARSPRRDAPRPRAN
jgi:hypothetical protein